MNTNCKVQEYENTVQAYRAVNSLQNAGYTKDNMYLFAHDKNISKDLTDTTDTQNMGVSEKGVIDTVANMFKSRGDELRNEFKNLGFTQAEAEQYEARLDQGKVLLVVKDYRDNLDRYL
ncbi:general stress protein [Aneurinibacillus aneurinilyticus]|uniref:general stress protein n=1 Tax=Aneurinibacillus aneurinilyticus TaxID=1391 RepID=UPI0023F42DDE|nr:general stress protein [Aneurinibacillus aneurinilyticus]